MDDLLALFEESVEDIATENDSFSATSRSIPASGLKVISHPSCNASQRPSVGIDDRIGIRMLNRKVSSVELTDLITDHPYHSTSQLSAYSLSQLNALLLDPAAVIDAATVNGKTNLITLGIVFTNSGSRVGPSGKAYCILTIGQLATGPTVSLLLFGACYHAYCRTLQPGKVVALVNPRLMSPKASPTNVGMKASSSRTTITFSVSDEFQLQWVADARDYGCCKAMLSSKNENGHWVKNGMFCKNYVDTRTGNFCHQHRHQAIASNGQGSSIATSSMREKPSSLQQLWVQAAAFPDATGALLNSTKTHSMKPPLSLVPGKVHTGCRSSGVLDPSLWKKQVSTENPLLVSRNTKTIQRAPSHNHEQPRSATTINPYAGKTTVSLKPPPPKCTKLSAANSTAAPSRKEFLTIDLSQERKRPIASGGKSSATLTGVKRRAVNTDSVGYHGSVPIPGPSKLFSQPKPNAVVQFQSVRMFQRRTDPLPSAQNILAQQELLAAQLRECKTINASGAINNRTKASQKNETSLEVTMKENLFCSAFDTIPKEDVLSAKSQFASEADAEAYALSRKVVSELEDKEYQTTNKKGNRPPESSNKIDKEWRCVTCKKTFSMKPMACLRMNHPVQVQRTIRETKSRVEERLLLTEKSPEEGGLVLGSGLEWSRFPRFS